MGWQRWKWHNDNLATKIYYMCERDLVHRRVACVRLCRHVYWRGRTRPTSPDKLRKRGSYNYSNALTRIEMLSTFGLNKFCECAARLFVVRIVATELCSHCMCISVV